MRKLQITLTLIVLFIIGGLQSQNTVNMQNGNVTACGDYFSDSQGPGNGGSGNPYLDNENYTLTICPTPGNSYVNVQFFLWNVGAGDVLMVYDGPNTSSPLIGVYDTNNAPQQVIATPSVNPSGCLTFVWTSDTAGVGAGWHAYLSCEPACQPYAVDVNFGNHDTTGNNGYIQACQIDTVTLTASGDYYNNDTWFHQSDSTTDFVWVFGDSSIVDTGAVFTLPIDTSGGAYRLSLFAYDSIGCEPDELKVFFILISTTPDFSNLSYDSVICPFDQQIITLDILPEEWTNSNDPFVSGTTALPDGNGSQPGVYSSTLTFNMFNPGDTISSLTDIPMVFLDIEHSFMGDLSITLECPNNSSVTLKQFPGGGGTNLGQACNATNGVPGIGWNYYFPFASTPVYGTMVANNGSTLTTTDPCTGFGSTGLDSSSFTPFTAATSLIGCPLNGTWELTIVDQWGFDDGTLFKWGIEFDSTLLPSTVITYDPGIADVTFSFDSTIAQVDSIVDSLVYISHSIADTNLTVYITVEDSFGCFYDTSFTYQIQGYCATGCYSSNTPTFIPTLVGCPGDSTGEIIASIDTLGAYAPYNVVWSSGGNQLQSTIVPGKFDTLTNLPSGVYDVSVTDSLGCMRSSSINLGTVPPMQLITGATAGVQCNGDCNGFSSVLVASGTAPYDFLWSDGTTLSSSSTLCPGPNWIEVIDARGCVDSAFVNITEPDTIAANLLAQDTVCIGNPVNLTASAAGGTAPYSYTFGNGVANTNGMASDTAYQTSTFEVYVTDLFNCSPDTAYVTVATRDSLVADILDVDTVCPGDTFFVHAQGTGGDGLYTYSWPNGDFGGSTSIVADSSSYYYHVTLTDLCGTPAVTDSVFVQVGGYPALDAWTSPDDTICEGEVANISAYAAGGDGVYDFNWLGLGGGQHKAVVPLVTTDYVLEVRDHCLTPYGYDTVTVVVGNFTNFELLVDTNENCAPGTFNFEIDSAIAAFYYYISIDGGAYTLLDPNDTNSFSFEDIGCHDVSMLSKTDKGCETEKTYPCMIQVYNSPVAKFVWDDSELNYLNPFVQLQDISTDADSNMWMYDSSMVFNQSFYNLSFEDTGSYPVTLVVKNEFNCYDSVTHDVVVDPTSTVYFPTGFSPNEDGVNETWRPIGENISTENYELKIFDRWGGLVYYTTDLNAGWNGTLDNSGEALPIGTYSYYVNYQLISGYEAFKIGAITLVK